MTPDLVKARYVATEIPSLFVEIAAASYTQTMVNYCSRAMACLTRKTSVMRIISNGNDAFSL